MKREKECLALLIAAVAVLMIGMTVFASSDPGNDPSGADGSITVRNSTIGATYKVYKIFDLTYAGEDEDLKVSYCYTPQSSGDAFLDAMKNSADSPFVINLYQDGTYGITIKDGTAPEKIRDFLNPYVEGDKKQFALTAGEDGNGVGGELVFADLPYGYYYISSSVTDGLATIDSTLKDVRVIDKNQKPAFSAPGKVILEKVLDENGEQMKNPDGTLMYAKKTENTVGFGEQVLFSIELGAPTYVDDALVTYYYFMDMICDGFDYNGIESIIVRDAGTGEEIAVLTDDDYTVRYAPDDMEGDAFLLTIPWGTKFATADAAVEIRYLTTLNQNAVVAGNGNPNEANFAYVTRKFNLDDPDDPEKPGDAGYPDDPYKPSSPDLPFRPGDPADPMNFSLFLESNRRGTKTYTYAIAVEKVDDNGQRLAGAKFSVMNQSGQPVKAVPASGIPGVYKVDAENGADQFETGDQGLLVIMGLGAGTYTVREDAAPAGYKLCADPVIITTAETPSQATEERTYYFDNDGNLIETQITESNKDMVKYHVNAHAAVLENEPGIELPFAGGGGTLLLYLIGGVMVFTAVLMMALKRLRNRA